LYSTEQVDAAPPDRLNGQVGELKVPFESDLKLTVPVGLDRVPLAVSVTVTVHVAACATTTGEPQLTAVLVVRGPTTTSLNPFDALCSAGSPPGYSAVILCVPDSTFVASYLTEQVDASPPDAVNAQVGELKVPFEFDLKLTDPLGLDRVGLAVSLTVTVHVVACATTTGELQLTAVVVSRAAAHACGHATSAQPRTSVRTAGLTPRRGSPSSIFESTFAILGMVAILTLDVRRSCVAEFRPKNGGDLVYGHPGHATAGPCRDLRPGCGPLV
jgi:hypothetical protein